MENACLRKQTRSHMIFFKKFIHILTTLWFWLYFFSFLRWWRKTWISNEAIGCVLLLLRHAAKFTVDELAFVAVGALSWSSLMPFLAHFRFIIPMGCFTCVKLLLAVGISALSIKLTHSMFTPVAT